MASAGQLPENMRVAILGTGAIGLGAAALLHRRGHAATLWPPNGAPQPGTLTADGALDWAGPVATAATCAEGVADASAVLVAVPGPAYRAVLDALAATLRPGQPVVISGHLSFAALYLGKLLAARGITAPIIAWGTTVTSGRRTAPGAVHVSSVRAEVDVASVPGQDADLALHLCQHMFGDRFRLRAGLLAVALSNVNPQNHLAIALCNLTRMERGEEWGQNSNITPAVGRLMEALDAERLRIAEAFAVPVRTLRQHFHLSFHVEPAPLGDMARVLAARGNDPKAPRTPDTRYVLEDAPFGLYPTTLLGRACGCPAPLHEAGLLMMSALYGRDLAALNDIVPELGTLDADRLRRLTSQGWTPD